MKTKLLITSLTASMIISGCATGGSVMTSISQLNQEVAQLKANTAQLTQKVDALQQSRIPSGVLAVESKRTSVSGYNPGGVVNPNQAGFQNSLALFQAGDVNGAIDGFEKYLNENPTAADTSIARYWLGSAFYTKQDYQEAQRYLGMYLSQNPNAEKSSEALSKLIMSLRALGRTNEANILQQQGVKAIISQ